VDNDEIIRRYEDLYAQRSSNFDQEADSIERYIAPIRGGKFFQEQSTEYEVQFRRPEVFDSTAMEASSILSASIQGAITPADTKWFTLSFRDGELTDDKDAAKWLEECGDIEFLALSDSSFEMSNQEAIQDLVDFGNTAVFEEEETKDGEFAGLAFSTIPIREIYFEEDYDGSVLTLYRRLQWTPLQIMSKFDKVPESIKTKAESPEMSGVRMDVIFCVYEREKFTKGVPVAATKRQFGSKYVLKEGRELIGDEGGYYEMPVFMTRWAKTSGSKYGHGPGHLALPTVFTLNKFTQLELAYVEKIVDPTTLVSERNVFGSLDLTAGAINVMTDIDGIKPYEANARYGEAKMTQEDLRSMVRSIYKVDQLQLKESPAMTATEAQMRANEILKLFGPTRGRIQREYLSEVVQRSFNILMRNGQFPAPPESVVQYQRDKPGTEMLDIQYIGPMARAQKQDEVIQLNSVVGMAGSMAEVFPKALDKIDEDEVVDQLVELTGVSAKIIRSDRDVKRIRDGREEREQAMAEAAIAQETGAGQQAMAEGEQALRSV
jgi:hypothetical protein